jgi:hypothetical protein
MKALGYKRKDTLREDFERLNETAFINITDRESKDGRKVFLVMFADRAPLNFPVMYKNDEFVVYEIINVNKTIHG